MSENFEKKGEELEIKSKKTETKENKEKREYKPVKLKEEPKEEVNFDKMMNSLNEPKGKDALEKKGIKELDSQQKELFSKMGIEAKLIDTGTLELKKYGRKLTLMAVTGIKTNSKGELIIEQGLLKGAFIEVYDKLSPEVNEKMKKMIMKSDKFYQKLLSKEKNGTLSKEEASTLQYEKDEEYGDYFKSAEYYESKPRKIKLLNKETILSKEGFKKLIQFEDEGKIRYEYINSDDNLVSEEKALDKW